MLHLSEGRLQEDFRTRFFATGVLFLIVFGSLLGRMWYLQVFNGRKFKLFSEQLRITTERIPAMRGRILDRNGVVIADTRPSFDVRMPPFRTRENVEATIAGLTPIFEWTEEEKAAILEKILKTPRRDPVVIVRDMARDKVARLLARKYLFPYIDVVHSPARYYPFGMHGSHALGYLGEISSTDLAKLKQDVEKGGPEVDTPEYESGDVWGISGVEKAFEQDVRGIHGSIPFIRDAHGRRIREEISSDILPAFQRREQVPGEDLVLTIDTRLQEVAEEEFKHESGAIVALDPKNGDVLVLLSRPEFPPEAFVRADAAKQRATLLKDPGNPLYDRALRGLYPPGSTFKIVTALGALTEKVVQPGDTVFCPGHYRLGRETKSCWKKEGHGWVNLHRAIVESCDVYFYEMGRRLGIDRIAKYGNELGLGKSTGIGINREEDGLVPTEAWKQRIYHQPWVGGETLSVAIGQGALQVTPIQLALAYATLANGGSVIQPRIALRTQTLEGATVRPFDPVTRRRTTIPADVRAEVLRGLKGVVGEVGGTAYWSARSQLVEIGGKTGTAQVVGKRSGVKRDDHAWFAAFAPADDPKIVVVVIVEYGGHGGTTAAPIARKIIETYLGGTG